MNLGKMTRIIDGARYNTETAKLVADDVYWNGSNFERNGRNTWLLKTPRGAFFTVTRTQWTGEQDTLEAVSREEAIELYEKQLPEHVMTWEQAFDAEPVEPEPGRPTLFGEKLIQTAVSLTREQVDWLKSQPDGVSATVRAMIDAAKKGL